VEPVAASLESQVEKRGTTLSTQYHAIELGFLFPFVDYCSMKIYVSELAVLLFLNSYLIKLHRLESLIVQYTLIPQPVFRPPTPPRLAPEAQ
jgi:hypothetical protein